MRLQHIIRMNMFKILLLLVTGAALSAQGNEIVSLANKSLSFETSAWISFETQNGRVGGLSLISPSRNIVMTLKCVNGSLFNKPYMRADISRRTGEPIGLSYTYIAFNSCLSKLNQWLERSQGVTFKFGELENSSGYYPMEFEN